MPPACAACWPPARRLRRKTCPWFPASVYGILYGFQELIQRVHDGAIGEVHTLQANDYRGPIWVKKSPARLDRHALANPQLVLLHVALGRFQR